MVFYLTLWVTYIVSPLELVYEDFRNFHWLRYLNLAIDAAWIVVMLSNFFRHKEYTDHYLIFKEQLFSFKSNFWIDLLAVIPPLVYLEKKWKINAMHLFRLVHFFKALKPVGILLKRTCPDLDEE